MMLSTTLSNISCTPPVKTPKKILYNKKSYRTPIRIQAPRMSPSPACFSTPRRRPMNVTNGDRFIPNRSRLNPNIAHRYPLNRVNEDALLSEYKQQLRRALFGKEESTNLLGFGGQVTTTPSACGASSSPVENPFDQDILRSFSSKPTKSTRPRSVNTEYNIRLEAPYVNVEDYLNLVSAGPSVAVALEEVVFISAGATVSEVRSPNALCVTAVKWGPDQLLAVGDYMHAIVWDVERNLQIAYFGNRTHFVTALEWKGENHLLAATSTGIQSYDMRLRFPEVASYNPFHHDDESSPPLIARMQWHDDVLMAAGGDSVTLWDMRQSKCPLRKMHHAGVKGLELCPRNSNMLATGGTNGIQLWNVQSGKLRTKIETPDPVTSVVWSPYREEIMASYGDVMGLWSFTKKLQRLAEWGPPQQQNGGRILSLERGVEGQVLSLHAGEALYGWDAFGSPPPVPKNFGLSRSSLLELPALR